MDEIIFQKLSKLHSMGPVESWPRNLTTAILLIWFFIVLSPGESSNGHQDCKQQSTKRHQSPQFGLYDLVIVNGTLYDKRYNEHIAVCLESNNDFTIVGLSLIHVEHSSVDANVCYCRYHYHRINIPNHMLRPFAIKKSKSFALTSGDRINIKLFYQALMTMISDLSPAQSRNLSNEICLPLNVLTDLSFAIIAINFGINGLYFSINNYFEPSSKNGKNYPIEVYSFFNAFYSKYLRPEPRSLANQAIANNVKTGDLVQIGALKQQSNTDLQRRAHHFGESFGQIFSKNATRKNSRNQIEYPIRSLFDSSMKLALRPKYLCKITKIYVHRISKDVMFSELVKLRELWKNKHNQVLYFPFIHVSDGIIFCINQLQNLLFEIVCRGAKNVIMDAGAYFFFPLIRGNPAIIKDDDVIDMIEKLPIVIDLCVWELVIERIKKNSKRKERFFIEGIEQFVHMHYKKVQNITEQESMRTFITGGQAFYQFRVEWIDKIQKDLKRSRKQNVASYTRLLREIREEMVLWIVELHPDYRRQFDEMSDNQSFEVFIMTRLHQLCCVSVIQNYLKANAKGHNLHVICYQDATDRLLQNLTVALAANINIGWNIHNLTMAQTVANEIVSDSVRPL